jgi:hypothetical protein
MSNDVKELPENLALYRGYIDGTEMTGEDIQRVWDNILAHEQPHEGFPLGALDRRVSVATTLLRKEGFIKMGRKGWEVLSD